MSADNGIYIVKTRKGFRVAVLQAVENLWWTLDGHETSELQKETVDDYFQNSDYYKTLEEAYKIANKLYDEIMTCDFPIVEYGIRYLGEIE